MCLQVNSSERVACASVCAAPVRDTSAPAAAIGPPSRTVSVLSVTCTPLLTQQVSAVLGVATYQKPSLECVPLRPRRHARTHARYAHSAFACTSLAASGRGCRATDLLLILDEHGLEPGSNASCSYTFRPQTLFDLGQDFTGSVFVEPSRRQPRVGCAAPPSTLRE